MAKVLSERKAHSSCNQSASQDKRPQWDRSVITQVVAYYIWKRDLSILAAAVFVLNYNKHQNATLQYTSMNIFKMKHLAARIMWNCLPPTLSLVLSFKVLPPSFVNVYEHVVWLLRLNLRKLYFDCARGNLTYRGLPLDHSYHIQPKGYVIACGLFANLMLGNLAPSRKPHHNFHQFCIISRGLFHSLDWMVLLFSTPEPFKFCKNLLIVLHPLNFICSVLSLRKCGLVTFRSSCPEGVR